jgi:hypothetical protein
MIKIIKYTNTNHNGGVQVLEPDKGQSHEEITLKDLIRAIEHRLNNIPNRDSLSYYSLSESTNFLVQLAYDLDRMEQYLEVVGQHRESKFVLNFTRGNYRSEYSIAFEGDLSTAILEFKNDSFSKLTKAPLITIHELRKKHLPINSLSLENGRNLFGNTVYYNDNSNQFCLPIRDLIEEAEDEGLVVKYSSSVKTIYNEDTDRLEIEIISLDSGVGNHKREYTYRGFIDFDTFKITIEKTDVYRFGN